MSLQRGKEVGLRWQRPGRGLGVVFFLGVFAPQQGGLMRARTFRVPRWLRLPLATCILSMLFAPQQEASAVETIPVTTPISQYFPNGVWSYVDSDSVSNFTFQQVIWDNWTRAANLRYCTTYCPAYEHETIFYTGPSQCWPGNYSNSWASDLPHAYLDTDFLDSGGVASRAGGTAFSAALSTGRWYFHWLRMDRSCPGGYPYKLKSQESYFDPNAFNCNGGPQYYQWCVYPRGYPNGDTPRDYVPHAAGFTTGPNVYTVGYNQLNNRSFESGFSGWTARGTISYTVYAGGAHEDNNFVEFNCVGATLGCSIFQDVSGFPINSQQYFTAEAALRCNASTACPVSFVLWGLGVSGNEPAVRYLNVPPGGWFVYGLKARGYAPHSFLRFEVYNNDRFKNLDVDFTTLHWADVNP